MTEKPASTTKKPPLSAATLLSDKQRLMMRLSEVSRRLREIDQRTRRLTLEHADITAEDYVARLRKTKEQLTRDAQRLLLKPDVAATAPSFIPLMRESSNSDQRYGFRKGKIILPESLPVTRSIQADQAGGGACPIIQDLLAPVSGLDEYKGDLHHGSTAGTSLDRSFRDRDGVVFAQAYLTDDAAWYRDDNPDTYFAVYTEEWAFPPAPCDMWVICCIDCSQRIEFTNAADDGGWAQCGVLASWTDLNGNFVSVNTRTALNTFNSSSSGSANSERFAVVKTFPVAAGRLAGFAVGHFIRLSAQDGTVEVLATCQTNQRDMASGPPLLWYMMIPQNSSCFLTTAICDVLGKADNCEELQCLRAFRDGYLAGSPDGRALISDYYQRAPQLLATLGAGPRRDAALRKAYDRYLVPVVSAIQSGAYARAVAIYRDMVNALEREALCITREKTRPH